VELVLEYFYHLVETNDKIGIGDVDVAEDGLTFTVDKPMSFKGLLMLFTTLSRHKGIRNIRAY
jgi:hypothetical protein